MRSAALEFTNKLSPLPRCGERLDICSPILRPGSTCASPRFSRVPIAGLICTSPYEDFSDSDTITQDYD